MDTQRGGSFAHTLRRATIRNLEGHGETPTPWKMVRAGHHRAHGSFQALQAEGPEWGEGLQGAGKVAEVAGAQGFSREWWS